jgi:sulfur-oxidizing protein SoxY
VSIRVKLAQSSNVYAVVKADGRFYSVVKAANVTVGGCG